MDNQPVNCWDFKQCGRQPGGKNVEEMGVCPAAIAENADGYLGGTNGGRACMFITGTFCRGCRQNSVEEKQKDCVNCDFYQYLENQFGPRFSYYSYLTYLRLARNLVQ